MRFGAFVAPFHAIGEDLTAAIDRDIRLVRSLDRLGFDEAWIGEHHSGGCETVGSPEILIAALARQTSRIRLGTGVISAPYHHPLMVADRIVLLDHLTKGRAMFGFGPGALPSDAWMLGIDPRDQRRRLAEAVPAIIALLTGDASLEEKTDWYVLRDARLQVAPYTKPYPEIAIASMLSPAGPSLAGTLGAGLLSLSVAASATSSFLANHWKVLETCARNAGMPADRARWRCVAPMHIAPTRQQAYQEVMFGIQPWLHYFRDVAGLPLGLAGSGEADPIGAINSSGIGMIGDVNDAIEFIGRIEDSSGGFGTFLTMAHEWADEGATVRSYELLIRRVAAAFREKTARERSREFVIARRSEFVNAANGALTASIRDYYGRSVGDRTEGNAK